MLIALYGMFGITTRAGKSLLGMSWVSRRRWRTPSIRQKRLKASRVDLVAVTGFRKELGDGFGDSRAMNRYVALDPCVDFRQAALSPVR